MASGNEVVAKNDPEEESKSVEDKIAEVLGVRTDTREEIQAEDTPVEVDTPAEIEVDTPAETEVDTPAETEVEPQQENINENAVEAIEDAEAAPEAEEEEEEEVDLIPPAQAEEEEEEVDLIDPVDEVREKCESQAACQKYLSKLEECNNRVSSRSETAETCHEEMMDWIHAVDHCVSQSLFSKVK